MSEAMKQRLLELNEIVERNLPIVDERIEQANLSVDPLLRLSMAKYWDTLERLAAE